MLASPSSAAAASWRPSPPPTPSCRRPAVRTRPRTLPRRLLGTRSPGQDLSSETRWPRWAPKTVAHGIAAVLSVELTRTDGHRLGAINNYWANPCIFTRDDVAFAHLFARHAALALEIAGLNVALDTRKRIGQAQGILMATYDLDEDRAFEVLRRYSQHNNVKLRDLADQVVTRRRLPTTP